MTSFDITHKINRLNLDFYKGVRQGLLMIIPAIIGYLCVISNLDY